MQNHALDLSHKNSASVKENETHETKQEGRLCSCSYSSFVIRDDSNPRKIWSYLKPTMNINLDEKMLNNA